MERAFIEGFGCSLNLGQTEKIKALAKKRFSLTDSPPEADFLIINTCAVKSQTENRMLKRIGELSKEKKPNARLAVCGCLPLVSPEKIRKRAPDASLLGTGLNEAAAFLGVQGEKSELLAPNLKKNEFVSIIPVSTGCLGNCAYCCVKNARGKLKSFSPVEIKKAFRRAAKRPGEIWLTSNDSGCYGFDLGTNLAELLESLLTVKGSYRVRIGMMNPAHAKNFFPELLEAMSDDRVYRFLHLPVQSGSGRVLKKMNRGYSVKEFKEIVGAARKKFPLLTLSTDLIAGFPGETKKDFRESLALIREVKPGVVNVSRFGARPGTRAEKLPEKIHGKEKKERSGILSAEARRVSLERNKAFVGKVQKIFVSGKGKKGGFIGRNAYYKPVIVEKAVPGQFMDARIERAFATYLLGRAPD